MQLVMAMVEARQRYADQPELSGIQRKNLVKKLKAGEFLAPPACALLSKALMM
jgi:hypothetical protein